MSTRPAIPRKLSFEQQRPARHHARPARALDHVHVLRAIRDRAEATLKIALADRGELTQKCAEALAFVGGAQSAHGGRGGVGTGFMVSHSESPGRRPERVPDAVDAPEQRAGEQTEDECEGAALGDVHGGTGHDCVRDARGEDWRAAVTKRRERL